MKCIKKNIGWVVCSVACLAILLLCALKFSTASKSLLRFAVSSDDGAEIISVFEGADGICYVFLPSYAKMEEVRVILDEDESVSIGGAVLTNGMNCQDFALETEYSFRNQNGKSATLCFYRSANIPAVYIDTATGSMENIHSNKDIKEYVFVDIYSSDGTNINSSLNGYLKGRGNATWGAAKKSYGLELSDKMDFFGMGKATEWILLANGLDETNLRNKIVFELARQTGMAWVPEYQYVDLYLNGEYNGLYMLIEKVEAGESRLNIDLSKGDFLCKVEFDERWSILSNPIKTESGRTIDLLTRHENDLQKEVLINELEKVLKSNLDLSESSIIDLDSWVEKYLIDEISANFDSDIASSYFYYYGDAFYGGPVWDYDNAFPITESGQFFRANQVKRQEGVYRVYYGLLYQNPSFYNRMVEIYEKRFVPVLEKMTKTDITTYASEIENAVKMNGHRWAKSTDAFAGADELIKYLEAREAFLTSAWIEGIVYHSVQVEQSAGGYYAEFSVKYGERLDVDMVDFENTVWYIQASGEKFDPNEPICEDVILVKQLDIPKAQNESGRELRVLVVYASLFCMVSIGIVLIIVDIYRGRRRAPK